MKQSAPSAAAAKQHHDPHRHAAADRRDSRLCAPDLPAYAAGTIIAIDAGAPGRAPML